VVFLDYIIGVNRLSHIVKYGKKAERRSYARIDEVLELPNLIEIQTDSYKWFLDEGLKVMFEDISPIVDHSENLELHFVDYEFKEAKYSLEEARSHDANYSKPIYVTLRLFNKETGEVKEQEVFFGDFPIMTEMGTFIINGVSFPSWCVLLVSISTTVWTRKAATAILLRLFLTVGLGWNLNQMLKGLPMSALTGPGRFH